MPQARFRLSPTKITTFRQCPRKYKYQYVDGLYEQYHKPWPHFTMGDHVHATLSEFLSQDNHDRSWPKMESILRRRWRTRREGFKTPEQEKEFGERALRYLRWFYDNEDVRAQPCMLEAKHQAVLTPDLTLVGKVDRVDRCEDGSFHIIDYKTGRTASGGDHLQLMAYAVLLGKKFRAPISRVSYLFLNGLGWQSVEPTDVQLREAEGRLCAARDEIIAEQEFAPTPGPLCSWCDFTEICDACGIEMSDYDLADEPEFWDE